MNPVNNKYYPPLNISNRDQGRVNTSPAEQATTSHNESFSADTWPTSVIAAGKSYNIGAIVGFLGGHERPIFLDVFNKIVPGTAKKVTHGKLEWHSSHNNSLLKAQAEHDSEGNLTAVKANNLSTGEELLPRKELEAWDNKSDFFTGRLPVEKKEIFIGDIGFIYSGEGKDMKSLHEFIKTLDISSVLKDVGSVKVKFGRTIGQGMGEWDRGSRTITINKRLANNTPDGIEHMHSTVLFELLNASSDLGFKKVKDNAISGVYEEQARMTGGDASELYARELEKIEFKNVISHRDILRDAGYENSARDVFSSLPGNFEGYYEIQKSSGHSESYRTDYHMTMLRRQT